MADGSMSLADVTRDWLETNEDIILLRLLFTLSSAIDLKGSRAARTWSREQSRLLALWGATRLEIILTSYSRSVKPRTGF